MKLVVIAGLSAGLCVANVFAGDVGINIRYQNVETSKIEKLESTLSVDTSSDESIVSDAGIEKSILVARLGNLFSDTLKESEKICKSRLAPSCARPLPSRNRPRRNDESRTRPVCRPNPEVVNHGKKCKKLAEKVALKFSSNLKRINAKILTLESSDTSLIKFISIGHKLADNIKAQKFTPVHRPVASRGGGSMGTRPSSPSRAASRPSGRLNVTTGGAKSVDHFIKTIEDGLIPRLSSFSIEGFLSHFDFPLESKECLSVLCINPAYKIDAKSKKMFIQLGMDTMITEDSFKRRKLNLSVVLDISGSMSAEDGTEISRIDWAKKALLKTVSKMNKEDLLSIVLFNGESQILLKPTPVTNTADIKKLIKDIVAEGSTDLEKGLRDGFNLVSEKFKKGYENRVILISDAGANTGATAEVDLVRLVSDFASENIGLTAIGLGVNFKQELIHGITLSKGSNYIFVNSGKGLKTYFEQFEFLVSPIAYNLKAKLELKDIDAKLVKAYGVPMKADSKIQNILDIRTLFLASEGGGGTILLEYDLK